MYANFTYTDIASMDPRELEAVFEDVIRIQDEDERARNNK